MSHDSLPLLQKLGFTAYEAKAWLALAQAETATLNGYEIAKYSGVPRANIYPVLKRLVERNAVRRVDAAAGARYVATPAADLLERIKHEQDELISAAQAALPRQPHPTNERPVYALQSETQVYDTVRRTIAGARKTLFIALQPHEAALLAPELRAADTRGVEITTLCMEACVVECGGCRGTIHRCAISCGGPCDDATRWLLVTADDAVVAAAEFDAQGNVNAIETHQPLVVQLAASYIRQSAALAVLGGELGDRFDGLVSLQARRLLDGLRPNGGFPHHAATAVAVPETKITRPVTGIKREDSQ